MNKYDLIDILEYMDMCQPSIDWVKQQTGTLAEIHSQCDCQWLYRLENHLGFSGMATVTELVSALTEVEAEMQQAQGVTASTKYKLWEQRAKANGLDLATFGNTFEWWKVPLAHNYMELL